MHAPVLAATSSVTRVVQMQPVCDSDSLQAQTCALHYAPLILLNSLTTELPNSQPAPLGLMANPAISSGSDHMRSQNAPS